MSNGKYEKINVNSILPIAFKSKRRHYIKLSVIRGSELQTNVREFQEMLLWSIEKGEINVVHEFSFYSSAPNTPKWLFKSFLCDDASNPRGRVYFLQVQPLYVEGKRKRDRIKTTKLFDCLDDIKYYYLKEVYNELAMIVEINQPLHSMYLIPNTSNEEVPLSLLAIKWGKCGARLEYYMPSDVDQWVLVMIEIFGGRAALIKRFEEQTRIYNEELRKNYLLNTIKDLNEISNISRRMLEREKTI